ncbi:MAG: divergent polysaccharide deacetylase family protein [Bdellovibrionales bacterium]
MNIAFSPRMTKTAAMGLAGVLAAALVLGAIINNLSNRPATKPAGAVSVSVAPPVRSVTVTLPPKPSATTDMAEAAATPGETPAAALTPRLPDSGGSLVQRLHDWQRTKPAMIDVPVKDLTVGTPDGLLPRIGNDNREPWQVYARPAPPVPQGVPQIAILMVDMGLSSRLTLPALEQLPGQISVALHLYSPNLESQIRNARAVGLNGGHEVLLDIPAEPLDYPIEDPGPDALLTRLSTKENLGRLYPMLAKAPGVIGIVSSEGSRFAQDPAVLTPVLQDMKVRGLAWIDVNHVSATGMQSITPNLAPGIGLANAVADMWIDDTLSPATIRQRLDAALMIAKRSGHVLVVARPYPLTVTMLAEFTASLPGLGVALVPASALLKKVGARSQ